MPQLISIVGPTASGKSDLAVALARQLACPVLSADSVQVYRGLDIGSGKLTTQEMQGVPHYLIDLLEPGTPFSAADYALAAEALIAELHQQYDTLIVAGGSGFYLHALWQGLDEMPQVDESTRLTLRAELETKGLAALVAELETVDPLTAQTIDKKNPVRVLRALEIHRASGQPISAFRKGPGTNPKPYRELRIGLQVPRAELYQRIDRRVLAMLEAGWLQETQTLLAQHGPDCPALQSLGYRELVSHLQGQLDYSQAVELIQTHTRQYAKRQETWFRRSPDLAWFDPQQPQAIHDRIHTFLQTT